MTNKNELRQLVCLWIEPATDEDIMNEAHLMKGGKAYLFKAEDELPILRHVKGYKNQWKDRKETFIKRVL